MGGQLSQERMHRHLSFQADVPIIRFCCDSPQSLLETCSTFCNGEPTGFWFTSLRSVIIEATQTGWCRFFSWGWTMWDDDTLKVCVICPKGALYRSHGILCKRRCVTAAVWLDLQQVYVLDLPVVFCRESSVCVFILILFTAQNTWRSISIYWSFFWFIYPDVKWTVSALPDSTHFK